MIHGRIAAFVLAALGVLTLAGCSVSDGGAAPDAGQSPPGGPALRPVTLPDLSAMNPSAQEQIRRQHERLVQLAGGAAAAATADAHGELGKLMMAADLPEAAETCFLNAQALAPQDFRWVYYLGHVYRESGQLEKSIAYFQRALQMRPDDVATLVWLGDLHLARGRPAEAEPRFERALTIEPGSLSARFGLGRAALAKEDFKQALANLNAVLERDPDAAAVHYPLALAYRGLGDSARAEAHLRLREDHEILPADPLMVELEELLESPQSYESRGIRALGAENWKEAEALFRKGLELDPSNPALRHRLGTAIYMMGDEGGARREFEAVVRTNPDHHMSQYSLGVLLQADGKHREAVDHFTAALRSRPSHTEARLRLAAGLRRIGRAKESLPHYEQVLAVNPDHVEAIFGQAMSLVRLGRFKEARDRLSDAMRAQPNQIVFVHGLARLLAAAPDAGVRDGERAMTLVQQLIEKGRTLDLGETMAMTLAELGRFEQAAAVQRDLLAAARKGGLDAVVPRLAANLERYERGEPCRTPWTADEMP